MPGNHSQVQHSRRPFIVQELEERLRSVQAENKLLGHLVKDFQADRDSQAQSLLAAQHAQDVAGHAAAQAKQKADDLQRQLASAQQEQLRLKTSFKAQSVLLEKSRAMQDEMADVLLSLEQECEEKGSKVAAAAKRIALLKDKLRQAERHLADACQQNRCLEEEARSQACSHQQAAASCQAESERMRSALAHTNQQLQEARATHESGAAASGEAYHRLQERQQALQASLAHHSLCSHAHQDKLHLQLHSLQSDLTAVKQERDAALTGLKALQMCDEKSRCTLHVGLSQVGDVRQQLIEAHRRCSEQQGTIVQLHAQLLSSHQHLQAKEEEAAHQSRHQLAARRQQPAGVQAEQLEEDITAHEVVTHLSSLNGYAEASDRVAALRQDLAAAREAEVSVMRSLQSELRRVHALERMCLNDVAQINTLHHQLHASQQSAWGLRDCVLKVSMSKPSCSQTNATVASLPCLGPPCIN